MHFGTVALVGRTNVGKSTFLNAALGEKLTIVSPLPQTTRDEVLGVVHRANSQIAFTDTPGLHRPKTELGRRMNARALDTARSHDVVVFMTDVSSLQRRGQEHRPDADPIAPDDRRLLQALRPDIPVLLVINKVDQIKDKPRLLPLLEAFSKLFPFRAVIPTSVRRQVGVEQVLQEIEKLLPEAEAPFGPDDVTDRPAHFFVREYVREQVLLQTAREVPHAVAVTVDRFEESPRVAVIAATIHVEKEGQRAILIGKGGQKIKEIGTAARVELEALLGKTLHLELFVRVTERWKDVPRQLSEMGYEASGSRELSHLLPKGLPRKRTARSRAGGRVPARGAHGSTRSASSPTGQAPRAKTSATPAKAAPPGGKSSPKNAAERATPKAGGASAKGPARRSPGRPPQGSQRSGRPGRKANQVQKGRKR